VGDVLPLPPSVLAGLDLAVSLVLITVLFALIYKVLPDVRLGWNDVWIGAGMTAVLFTAGKFLIGLYLGRAAIASAYGAAGSALVILLWAYYASLIFLLGAEFTEAQARYRGWRPEPTERAERLPDGARQPARASAGRKESEAGGTGGGSWDKGGNPRGSKGA
jgi:membrane protein